MKCEKAAGSGAPYLSMPAQARLAAAWQARHRDQRLKYDGRSIMTLVTKLVCISAVKSRGICRVKRRSTFEMPAISACYISLFLVRRRRQPSRPAENARRREILTFGEGDIKHASDGIGLVGAFSRRKSRKTAVSTLLLHQNVCVIRKNGIPEISASKMSR